MIHSTTQKRSALLLATALIACLAMALTLALSANVSTAYAGGSSLDVLKAKKAGAVFEKKSDLGQRAYWAIGSNAKKKITSAKSSNTKVATVEVANSNGQYCLVVNVKKKGTTNISFKHAGKKYKVKYTVSKYSNPVKSLKIGSQDYASAVKLSGQESCMAQASDQYLSGKVDITPSKNWKVSGKINAYTASGFKTISNKGTVTDSTSLWIVMKNTKTGASVRLIVQGAPRTTTSTSSLSAAAANV